MKIRIIACLWILPLLAVGCASHATKDSSVWSMVGKSQDQIEQDLADCRFKSGMASTGLQGKNAAWYYATKRGNENQLVEDCMKAKGYKLQPR